MFVTYLLSTCSGFNVLSRILLWTLAPHTLALAYKLFVYYHSALFYWSTYRFLPEYQGSTGKYITRRAVPSDVFGRFFPGMKVWNRLLACNGLSLFKVGRTQNNPRALKREVLKFPACWTANQWPAFQGNNHVTCEKYRFLHEYEAGLGESSGWKPIPAEYECLEPTSHMH